MRRFPALAAAATLTALSLVVTGPSPIAGADQRPTAAPDDAAPIGWATAAGGTDGGTGAPEDSIYTVSDRSELLAALDNQGRPDDPKIIYVTDTIHGNETADGRLLGEQDYAPGYDLDKYLSCFGPDGWSDSTHPYCGDQRRLRQTGSNNMKRQNEIKIGSNTTLLGVGDNAGFDASVIMFHLDSDIVLRNLTIEAPVDHFTSWDPYDGADGSWNARFDAMSAVAASNIWIDHVTFTDGRYPDSSAPEGPNGKPVNFHDGLFDIKDGSDYITITDSKFLVHDKAMLIGSGDDNADTDLGKLRVTIAGSHFDGVCQRSPRVRFGQVHVLNNYYSGSVQDPVAPLRSAANGGHCYYLGLGYESSVVSEGNAFSYEGPGADATIAVRNWNATRFTDQGSWFRGDPIDLNEQAPGLADAGWDPGHVYDYRPVTDYDAVKHHAKQQAGAGVLRVIRS